MDDSLYALAAAFVTGELIPTLVALIVTAACEPMTWSVAGVARLAWVLCRPWGRSA
jgi:hypothetical protein